MKIALIFPRFKYPSGDIPIGLAYLASIIKKETDSDIEIIDTTFHKKGKKNIADIFSHKHYDLVGISCMTPMIKDGFEVAEIIKKTCPKTKIIFGGPHPTVLPEHTLKHQSVDAVCVGEGEYTFLELVNKKADFRGIDGIWYKDKKGNIIRNNRRQPIENLDAIPFPVFEMFPRKDYIQYWFQLDSVARNLKGMNIITSRGCPYQCSFCQPTLKRIFGQKIRRRSPQNVVDEIKYLKERYAINALMFQDDTLVADKNWVNKMCDLLIKDNIEIIWGCNSRVNLVEKDLFAKMKKAGLKKVFVGIESGSQRILNEIYRKEITHKQILKAVDILNTLNLKIQGYFMIGAPTESEKEINDTIKFAKSLNINEATFSITTPLPGTYLHEKTKRYINTDISNLDYYNRSVYNKKIALGQKKLNWFKRKALLLFYFSPKHIKYTIKSFTDVNAIQKSFMKLKRF